MSDDAVVWRRRRRSDDGRRRQSGVVFRLCHNRRRTDRSDDRTLLAELAETRAMKRATSWATAVGMTAVEEIQNAVLSEE